MHFKFLKKIKRILFGVNFANASSFQFNSTTLHSYSSERVEKKENSKICCGLMWGSWKVFLSRLMEVNKNFSEREDCKGTSRESICQGTCNESWLFSPSINTCDVKRKLISFNTTAAIKLNTASSEIVFNFIRGKIFIDILRACPYSHEQSVLSSNIDDINTMQILQQENFYSRLIFRNISISKVLVNKVLNYCQYLSTDAIRPQEVMENFRFPIRYW